MNEKEKRLFEMIGKLKRNRQAVAIEDLRGKYGAPYRRLQGDIKEAIRQVILDSLYGVKVDYGSAQAVFGALQKAYDEGGYSKRLGKAAFTDMDADEAIRIAREAKAHFASVLAAIGGIFPDMLTFSGEAGAA